MGGGAFSYERVGPVKPQQNFSTRVPLRNLRAPWRQLPQKVLVQLQARSCGWTQEPAPISTQVSEFYLNFFGLANLASPGSFLRSSWQIWTLDPSRQLDSSQSTRVRQS